MGRRIRRAYLKHKTPTYRKGGIAFFHANLNRHPTHTVPPSKMLSPGQKEINQSKQIEELSQSDFWQVINQFNRVIVEDTIKYQIFRYFSGNRNFFVKEDFSLNITQRSIEYKDKEQAMRFYNLNYITWVQCEKSSLVPEPKVENDTPHDRSTFDLRTRP